MFICFSFIRSKMNDRCEHSQTKSNIRLMATSAKRNYKLFDTYPMLFHSNVNCLYFIISVK